jgi:hypothetical protein
MKNDFKKMEEEMDNLSVKMSAITAFNDKISNTLQDKRLQITKLSGVHALLRKVCEFFYTLIVLVVQCSTGCLPKNWTLFDFMQRKNYKSYCNEIKMHSETTNLIYST